MISLVSGDGTFVGVCSHRRVTVFTSLYLYWDQRFFFFFIALHVRLYQSNSTIWKALIADKAEEQIPEELLLVRAADPRRCIITMETFVHIHTHFTSVSSVKAVNTPVGPTRSEPSHEQQTDPWVSVSCAAPSIAELKTGPDCASTTPFLAKDGKVQVCELNPTNL